MELFSERERLQSLAQYEAQGMTFWTDEIPKDAGTKLAFAWEDLLAEMPYGGGATLWGAVQHIVQRSIVTTQKLSPSEAWSRGGAVPTAMTYLEAAVLVLGAYCDTGECPGLEKRHVDGFIDRVNEVFRAHRISFNLVNRRQTLPTSSRSTLFAVRRSSTSMNESRRAFATIMCLRSRARQGSRSASSPTRAGLPRKSHGP